MPVLFLSSFSTVEKYIRGVMSGIFYHVNLPCKKEYLLKTIETIFNEKHQNIQSKIKNHILINYNQNKYLLDIKNNDLSAFMLSAMLNSIEQKKILTQYINEKEGNNIIFEVKNVGMDAGKEYQDINLKKDKEFQAELGRAFDNKEFEMFYQPIHTMNDNRLVGFEALIRWNHPEKGMITPDDFIPEIEKSHLIFPIGFWIIEEACRQLNEWRHLYNDNFPLKISINLSPKQFHHTELINSILRIIDKYELDPADIIFEITESVFMHDIDVANTMLLELKSHKIKIYMDDFGTGYSSLSYLMHFPVDTLKIDKSFVQWMHVDEQSEEIVRAVIGLAHNLNMEVVSEGIETEEHVQMLRNLKSDYGQGYYYSKPLNSRSAGQYIAKSFNMHA